MRAIAVSLAAFAATISAAFLSTSASADGLYRTSTGPGGADFSGLAVGIDVGAGFGTGGSLNTSGAVAGVHAGYNLQNGPIVGGVEADALFGSVSGGLDGVASYSVNTLSSAHVKAGYAIGDIMGYGLLGWGFSTTNYQLNGATVNKTIDGIVFGVGAEYALTRAITARAELRRYDFGSNGYSFPARSTTTSTDSNMVLIGLSTHF